MTVMEKADAEQHVDGAVNSQMIITEKEDTEQLNFDRLTCLRADELDLVKPTTDEMQLRLSLPFDQAKLAQDIYISADKIQITKLLATLHVERTGENDFTFEVNSEDDDGLVDLQFWISGLEILFR